MKRKANHTSVRPTRRPALARAIEQLESRQLMAADPVISEFLAANGGPLRDENAETSDWVEIHNAGDTALDLSGWHLTDDATATAKWTFPSRTLGPDGYLVVFASGKDRAPAS